MKKRQTHPSRPENKDLDFDEFYREISSGWLEKSHQLQARRWRARRRSLRGD
ncbi:MAG: hypothetical protein QFB87_01135 [Patescibacteria group bacterium]|nr:hypothetical protein [Patescibacteria group bacterium]